ncbi:hypothetical protein LXL04_034157 [Taraxacum kok-saghyz]
MRSYAPPTRLSALTLELPARTATTIGEINQRCPMLLKYPSSTMILSINASAFAHSMAHLRVPFSHEGSPPSTLFVKHKT